MSHSNTYYPWDDMYYYEDEYYPEPSYNQQNLNDSLHPEEPWMYNRWGGTFFRHIKRFALHQHANW